MSLFKVVSVNLNNERISNLSQPLEMQFNSSAIKETNVDKSSNTLKVLIQLIFIYFILSYFVFRKCTLTKLVFFGITLSVRGQLKVVVWSKDRTHQDANAII